MALSVNDIGSDPIVALRQWVGEAREALGVDDPVFTLATTDNTGAPDARLVVVREIGEDGLTFYNDSRSPKGRQLASEPRAAMVAYWRELGRQIRIKGVVKVHPTDVSDAAFDSRERRSQIGYWANEQSASIRDRDALEANLDETLARFGNDPIPRPEYWVSCVLKPNAIEFWQHGERHLHDRIAFTLIDNTWDAQRLQP